MLELLDMLELVVRLTAVATAAAEHVVSPGSTMLHHTVGHSTMLVFDLHMSLPPCCTLPLDNPGAM